MGLALPSLNAAAVDASGRFTTSWTSFFSRLVGAPSAIQAVSLSGSPFSFTAPMDGTVYVTGGNVSAVQLTRGRDVAAVAGGAYPVSQGDVVAITYASAPVVSFVPRTT